MKSALPLLHKSCECTCSLFRFRPNVSNRLESGQLSDASFCQGLHCMARIVSCKQSAITALSANVQCSFNQRYESQELWLGGTETLPEGPGSLGEYGRPDPVRQQYLDTCRLKAGLSLLKAGLSLRKAVDRLPRLTSLLLVCIDILHPGLDCLALHPWTHLR